MPMQARPAPRTTVELLDATMRAIGISSPERLAGIDVPTFKEQGVDAEPRHAAER